MLKTLRIENFRCFPAFELQKLGQLNLLVGENNSGKTSILEAIQLLAFEFNLESLAEIMISRGEYISYNERRDLFELDFRHLFHGHKIDVGSKFSISSDNNHDGIRIIVSIDHMKKMDLLDELQDRLAIHWVKQGNKNTDADISIQLSARLGFELSLLRNVHKKSKERTQFVTSSSLTTNKMVELFDQVVLTPEEDTVMEALQTIEPSIKRIASVKSENYYAGSHSGFIVGLVNGERIPIGNMGDGIWRMLGLTLAIVSTRNGILLVDEIDTGLHFTAMSKMWKLIWETAKRLNVQVFATTHSSDCWKSLTEIASMENPSKEGITIQRIERDKPSSVVFTERQIVIAAEREIEVR